MVLNRISVALLAACLLPVAARADLGPISVQSRQGEPFRAEVAVTEAATLDLGAVHTGLASRATFNQLNINAQPELAWLTFALVQGNDGPVVRIRSRRPIMSSSLQFVLQISGPGGSWVRPYTVRLETRPGAPAARAAASAPAARPAPAVSARPAVAAERTIRVTPGSTTASLAHRILIKGVSLERAGAALYLANRDRFIGGDPLRPRVGATLKVPSDAAMRAMTAARAREIFHPRLPASATHAATATTPAHAARPEAAHTAPAAEHAAPAAAPAHAARPEPAHATPAPAPAAHPPAPAHAEPAHESAPGVSASAAAAMAASEAAANRQIQSLKQQVDHKTQDLQKANQNIDSLKKRIRALEASQAAAAKALSAGFDYRDPKWLAAGGGGALALLLGLFFWRRRRRGGKGAPKPAAAKPLSSTGVTQPDPSAAEAAGKGDPLAEAEVYLAYGHDDQAENILRAALELHPGRQDIRAKLLEIYAARPDTLRFAELARDVHDAYDGRGAMWERTRAMGIAIDPDNPLYQPDGVAAPEAEPLLDLSLLETPAAVEAAAPEAADALEDMLSPEMASPAPVAISTVEDGKGDSLLDFDFSIDAQGAPAEVAVASPSVIEAPPEAALADAPDAGTASGAAVDAALDWPAEALADMPDAPQPGAAPSGDAAPDTPAAMPAVEAEGVEAPSADALVEAIEPRPSAEEEALATKLDLARVYLDMGDNEGAREVLQEVQREARGTIRQQADDMLARMV